MKYYDLIVIGSGGAGLVVAIGASKAGLKVLIIEKGNFGGDCTNFGCIPSKTLISNANRAHALKELKKIGLTNSVVAVEGDKLMTHVRYVVDEVKKTEDKEALEKKGLDVLVGKARFLTKHKVQIALADKSLIEASGKKIVIATGAVPAIPDIKGLEGTPYLTNETVFSMKDVPASLGVIGGGAIGCELAQAFSRVGSNVMLFQRGPKLLPYEEDAAQDMIEKQFREEGIKLFLGNDPKEIHHENNSFALTLKNGEKAKVDRLLVAVGRVPNITDLNLGRIGIDAKEGLKVDRYCRTSCKNIFAIGDAVGPPFFTHSAEFQARAVLQSILTHGVFKGKAVPEILPRVTFTDPEVASFGLKEIEAKKRFRFVKTYNIGFDEIDRAITNTPEKGEIRIVTKKWSSKILGATIIASRAGEMSMELILAMQHKIALRKLSKIIYPYPIYSSGIKKLADRYLLEVILPLFRKRRL